MAALTTRWIKPKILLRHQGRLHLGDNAVPMLPMRRSHAMKPKDVCGIVGVARDEVRGVALVGDVAAIRRNGRPPRAKPAAASIRFGAIACDGDELGGASLPSAGAGSPWDTTPAYPS